MVPNLEKENSFSIGVHCRLIPLPGIKNSVRYLQHSHKSWPFKSPSKLKKIDYTHI
jgi:hypothetical protein